VSEATLWALRATGWLGALALAAALAATPLGRLDPRALRARRPLGIAAALAALTHGAVALGAYVGDEWAGALTAIPWMRSGALALALLLPLLATSFPPVVRRLGVRLWKPLHRLAYVSAALAVHHVLLAPFAPRAWGLALAALLFCLALARVPGRRRDATMADP
jgi:sulfoxide reductase heme-binding subunit YedZ